MCSSDISIVTFPSSAFKCGIYSEPWFQKCPKLTMTQAVKEKKRETIIKVKEPLYKYNIFRNASVV